MNTRYEIFAVTIICLILLISFRKTRTLIMKHQAEIGKIEAEYQAEIGNFEELFIGEEDVYSFQSIFNYKTFVFYQDTDPSLAKLSEFYGSDKGNLEKYNNPYPWASHNYTDFYSRLFKDRRSTVKKFSSVELVQIMNQ